MSTYDVTAPESQLPDVGRSQHNSAPTQGIDDSLAMSFYLINICWFRAA